jgi:outer membrane protein assembly factor BamB
VSRPQRPVPAASRLAVAAAALAAPGLAALTIVAPVRAQVRPLVLADSSRPGALFNAPLYPPRRATLRALWEVPSGGTIIDGMLSTAAGLVYAVREGRLRCHAAEDGLLLWETALGSDLSLPPATDGARIFVAAGAEAMAITASDGRLSWRVPLPAPASSGPAVGASLGVMTLADGSVLALRSEDGSVAWTASPGCTVSSPPGIGPALAAVGCEDGQVVAFQLGSGRIAWRRRTGARVRAAPLVSTRSVFVGNDDGRISSFSVRRGGHRFTARAAADVLSRPVEDGKLILAGAMDNLLYACRPRSGHLVWRGDIGYRPLSPPAVRGEIVVASPVLARDVVVFDARDGSLLVRRPFAKDERISAAAPVFHETVLLVSSRPTAGGPGWVGGFAVDIEEAPEGPALFNAERTDAASFGR